MGLETIIKSSEIIEHFTPKQLEAFSATFDHRYILYGGARGGGKSRLLRWWLLLFLLYEHSQGNNHVRVGLFCETYRDLQDRQISKMNIEFPAQLGQVKDSKGDGLAFYLPESIGGGVIALRNLDDPTKYQSAEFAAIGIDELTKITKDKFDILRGSLRWPGVSHTVFMGTTNPGGIGHLWVKQLWLDRQFPPELESLSNEFAFVRSLPSDNPHLDKTYWADLNSLPDDLRRAWVEGDWNVFAGQAFTVWSDDKHIVNPFTIPEHWPRYRGIDWGYAKPFCCLWGAKNPDNGRWVVYREAYHDGLTDQQQARLIKEITPLSEHIQTTFADPSMWASKNVQGIVSSSADEYASEAVNITPADNDRLSGKRKIDRLLVDMADGLPGLVVFKTCENLRRTLPALPYSKKNVEDVDTDAEDHAYDALKYLLTSLPEPTKPQQKRKHPLSKLKYI